MVVKKDFLITSDPAIKKSQFQPKVILRDFNFRLESQNGLQSPQSNNMDLISNGDAI